MSASTFAEKVLARGSNLAAARAGQIVEVEPDLALTHDNTAAIARKFEQLPVERVRYPDRLAVVLDHAVPAPNADHARNHDEACKFVAQQGIGYFSEAGRGVCHQVLCEDGLVTPGMVVLGADSHSTHYGALGAFGAGIGRSEMAAVWATGKLWLRVPESQRITLSARLPAGVSSKDLALRIVGDLGADGSLYHSIEFHGQGLESLTVADRMVLANMISETGAKNVFLPPDQATLDWVSARARRPLEAIYPDDRAVYLAEHSYRLDEIEPMIACPHSVENVVPLSQVAGKRIHQAFLGTCTNGRLEDLAAAAEVVQGRHVAPGTRFLVIPASAMILRQAIDAGYVQALLQAGAILGTPGCGPCMGVHQGVLAPGEACISSSNRNFRGRMGEPQAEIYLASPRLVAAAAVAGVISKVEDL